MGYPVSANSTTKTFTDSWATGTSSQTGEQVVVHTGRWTETENRHYGTPGQIMGQWLAFNPFEGIARDLGASQRQAFWIGVAGTMVGNPKQLFAQSSQKATQYSVFFEAQTAKNGVGTRAAHFADANKSLQAAMAKDAQFAKMADDLGIRIPDRLGQSPAGWSWHHVPDRPGLMQLVPRQQHQGSSWQSILHPGRVGGFKSWGHEY